MSALNQAGIFNLIELPVYTDRKKKPDLFKFRTMTLDEIKALIYGDRVWFVGSDGKAREIKINGQVRRWKRDPDRVEVPVKYGMYEYGQWDTQEALRRLIVPLQS